MFSRTLNLAKRRSCLLLGPRQTGKSTLVRGRLRPHDLYLDLLLPELRWGYGKDVRRFRQEVMGHFAGGHDGICVIDEIQKMPRLLDEVHHCIEAHPHIQFILTGSSARKIRRGSANLLAGRANAYHLFPLTAFELDDHFDLERALLFGCLPYVWQAPPDGPGWEDDFLRAYAHTYLREEVQEEGLVRQVEGFAALLDVVALNDGQVTNFTSLGRDCGISVKTVQAYHQILEDTLLIHRVPAWHRSVRRRLTLQPKYYGFDPGVTNALCLYRGALNREVRGRRFEQFIFLQMVALNAYHDYGLQFFHWRTHRGLEVDFLLVRRSEVLALVEVKSTDRLDSTVAQSLLACADEHPRAAALIVFTGERPRRLADGAVMAQPWRRFLQDTLPELIARQEAVG